MYILKGRIVVAVVSKHTYNKKRNNLKPEQNNDFQAGPGRFLILREPYFFIFISFKKQTIKDEKKDTHISL